MCFEIAKAVWDYNGKDLNGVQTAILARMAWYASSAGRDIFPSKETLVEQTKFSLSAVKSAIKYLIQNNFLIECTKSKGRHSTTYRINLERLKITQLFDQSSSTFDLSEPVARKPVVTHITPQPVARKPVNRSGDDRNRSGDDHIKTNKDNYKNSSSNAADYLEELISTSNASRELIAELVAKHGNEMLAKQLLNLSKRFNVANPDKWLRVACAKNYELAAEENKMVDFAMSPASYEVWTPCLQQQRNKAVEAFRDPNDWREQEMQKYIAQHK